MMQQPRQQTKTPGGSMAMQEALTRSQSQPSARKGDGQPTMADLMGAMSQLMAQQDQMMAMMSTMMGGGDASAAGMMGGPASPTGGMMRGGSR